MPIRPPVNSFVFAAALLVFALLALGLAVNAPANTAFAADCLAAPDSSTPPDAHWYYRTDRALQRKCWYLRSDNQAPEQATAQAAREASPARPSPTGPEPYSLARFKEFMAQNGKAKLSDQDVAKLYAEFLEWRHRAKN